MPKTANGWLLYTELWHLVVRYAFFLLFCAKIRISNYLLFFVQFLKSETTPNVWNCRTVLRQFVQPVEGMCVCISSRARAWVGRKRENYKLPVLSFAVCHFLNRGFCMQGSRVQFTSFKVTRMVQHEGSRDEPRFSTAFTAWSLHFSVFLHACLFRHWRNKSFYKACKLFFF